MTLVGFGTIGTGIVLLLGWFIAGRRARNRTSEP